MPRKKKQQNQQEDTTANDIHFFWNGEDYCSQFYPAPFVVDGVPYNGCEQYMMHQKALVFQDPVQADMIMEETEPKTIKNLGRCVENFVDDVWTNKCRSVVYNGNYAKFGQNDELRSWLMGTGDRLLAEASPFDKRWGIGMGKDDKRAQHPSQWKGSNWLGEVLMKVRQQLRIDEANGVKSDIASLTSNQNENASSSTNQNTATTFETSSSGTNEKHVET